MPVIPFGQWAPDQPVLNNPCITAKNVYPASNGYRPFKSGTIISDALPTACLGAAVFPGFVVAGTATKLFRLVAGVWTDISGAVYTAARWRFTIFGQRVIATNGVNAPQKFDIAASSVFSDLAAAPTHNFPFVVRDFLIAADVTDGSIFELKFSARNNSEKYTADCGGGAQQFPDGGKVLGGTGGEIGLVFQEKAVTRMNFVGGDLVWTFDKLEGAVGTKSAESIIPFGVGAFYFTETGFALFDGAQSRSISNKRVSRTFLAQLDEANVANVRGAIDPKNQSVVWNFPISGGSKLVIYDFSEDKWSEVELALSCLVPGPNGVLAGFDATNKFVELTGANLAATLSTGDIELAVGRKTRLKTARMLTDATHTCTVGTRDKLDAAITQAVITPNSNGICNKKTSSRFHRFQANLSGSWTEATGIDIKASVGGRKN